MNTIPRLEYNAGDTLLIPVREGLSPSGYMEACDVIRATIEKVYGMPINVIAVAPTIPMVVLSAVPVKAKGSGK